MVSDEDVIARLRAQVGWRYAEHLDSHHPADSDYRFTDLRVGNGNVDMAIEQRDGVHARLVVALPSSKGQHPWLYAEPENADAWIQQFLIWTDEEVLTGGLTGSRARVINGGESYLVVTAYGWQLSDPEAHRRLLAESSAGL